MENAIELLRHENPGKCNFIHTKHTLNSVWCVTVSKSSTFPCEYMGPRRDFCMLRDTSQLLLENKKGCSCFAGKFGQSVHSQCFSDQTPTGHIPHVLGNAHKQTTHGEATEIPGKPLLCHSALG